MSARTVIARAVALLGLCCSFGCSEAEVVQELRSLQGSGDAVFVCRDANGLGHPMSDCPDLDASDDDDPTKRLSIYSLVTQTITNEIAVVDVTGGHVVDTDPATPGYGFLRVGGRPIAMANSPGGLASFVTTADVGQNGIFGLPTACLDAPAPGEELRDLTTWPACRLDAAPGALAAVVESQPAACSAASDSDGNTAGECHVDLGTEKQQGGPLKLVVSMPDQGELIVVDAQWLLDREPGTFPPCHIEARIPLRVDVPAGVTQTLPPDLQTTCNEAPAPTAPPTSPMGPRPGGFALAEQRLYISDTAAPVIHVMDASSACGMTELPSLLPMSLREPTRVVTTRRVAASPLTPSGKRYVYAIDSEDQPGASVMAFDVSPGSTDPTPIVRSGSPELTGEKPDRLAIGSSARDISFVYRDLPYADPVTGVAEFGTLCDPDPSAPLDSPGALARSSSDYTTGARPGLLRGLFAFILLTNGAVSVVDVEDFDSPCRRPVSTNSSGSEDFRGCANDPADIASYTLDGVRTVTDEVSCRVVAPHRFRAATLAINDVEVGVRAPSLRGLPQLDLPPGGAATRIEDRARVLGVHYAGGDGKPVDAEVFVGSTLYSTAENAAESGAEPMPVDPNSRASEQSEALNAVVLPPLQPRAYASEDTARLVYEGSYAGDRNAGFLRPASGELPDRLEDVTLSFCASGVYDEAAMTDYAGSVLGASNPQKFAAAHSDYVQLTTTLLSDTDSYWQSHDRRRCVELFGVGVDDADNLLPSRDFRIVKAYAYTLELASRTDDASLAQAQECFPGANTYRLRTGQHWALLHSTNGFNHDIVASGADSACVRSCDPLKKWARSRAFEISSSTCRKLGDAGDPLDQRVGCSRTDDYDACVYDQGEPGESGAVQIGGPASSCIFDGLTSRFALYRGRAPSQRDAVFTWSTSGGFSPLLISLTNLSAAVLPSSVQYVPQIERLAVVDGSSLGLSLVDFNTFAVSKPSPFF